ncbi:hypothetical protein FB381_1577 [Nocardioides albertanoniae]|uniref:Phosphotransferase family enzyme n=1 Tax=Nocardioides albertanoniae TaxID=1175486 RepID=A0A543A519_9ACTN|nr:hypothetical protein [Nocardioides albertanoniae]TQL67695.1 hypothetical protein FB381_1577 [Nocardioides albertanoniae]
MSAIPTTIPHGQTARRLEWAHLPPFLRAAIEKRLGGGPVVDAESQAAGYTPGFASVLTCRDGSTHFVKAASAKAQRASATVFREEAAKLKKLAGWIPAPKLEWFDDGEWVVMAFEHVEARLPARPWTPEDLETVSGALIDAAGQLTPAPGIGWPTFAEEYAAYPELWERTVGYPDAERAAEIAAGFAEHTAGETLLHLDVRDDTIRIRPDGSVLLVEWTWPVVGAEWIDSLMLLVGPRGDGLDVESLLSAHPLLSQAAPEAIDSVLALFAGYFLAAAEQPLKTTSPHLRRMQRWQGEVCLDWLSERRGWE